MSDIRYLCSVTGNIRTAIDMDRRASVGRQVRSTYTEMILAGAMDQGAKPTRIWGRWSAWLISEAAAFIPPDRRGGVTHAACELFAAWGRGEDVPLTAFQDVEIDVYEVHSRMLSGVTADDRITGGDRVRRFAELEAICAIGDQIGSMTRDHMFTSRLGHLRVLSATAMLDPAERKPGQSSDKATAWGRGAGERFIEIVRDHLPGGIHG
jgi:hypothetical protein